MRKFRDTNTGEIIIEEDLRKEFEEFRRTIPEEYDYSFNQYIQNCSETLEEIPEYIGDAKVLDSLTELPKIGEKETMDNYENEKYTCDFCGFSEGWEDSDDVHGTMWGCEVCGRPFCRKCFVDEFGFDQYMDMVNSGEYIRCPDCQAKANKDVVKKIF